MRENNQIYTMPISDILAQIAGEKPFRANTTIPHISRGLPAVERNVEISQFNNGQPSHQSVRAPVRPVNAPTPTSRNINSITQPSLAGPRVNPSSLDLPHSFRTVASGRVTKHSTKSIRSRTAASSGAETKEPKKGSYAEIMARAERVQALTGHVGKIQHMPVDRQVAQRGHQEGKGMPRFKQAATPNPRMAKTREKSAAKLPAPNSRTVRCEPATQGPRVRAEADMVATNKVKKAAVATTGYTGTARPKLNSTSQISSLATHDKTRLTSHRPHAFISAGRPRREEYDHDMDDFIDYDDDDDRPHRRDDRALSRYDSDSDHSSSMEADVHDIEGEERRTARIAVEEDRREEEMERKLKLSKLVARRKAPA